MNKYGVLQRGEVMFSEGKNIVKGGEKGENSEGRGKYRE
jgi:hypothetical protein